MPKKILPLLILFAVSGFIIAAEITISEIMFDAVGSDYYDEFIEIVNYGDLAVDLEGFYLEIDGNPDTIAFIDEASLLNPGEYALILDRGYLIDQKSATYESIIPDTTLRCTIQDNAFGSGGLSNSAPIIVLLLNNGGDTLSLVNTTPDQQPGYSDEKIDLDSGDLSANWGNSSVLYGTPGFRNSISRRDHDLAITDFRRRNEDQLPHPGSTVEFILTIKNRGRNIVENAEVVFGIDWNRDTTLQISEVQYNDVVTVSPLDSVILSPSLQKVKSGKLTILAEILEPDEEPENNNSLYNLRVPYQAGALLINEFMYAPETDRGGEWIELLNISSDTIDLAHWQVFDAVSGALITSFKRLVEPGSFAVLSSDTTIRKFWDIREVHIACEESLPGLNNTEDSIVVRDLCGIVIDALQYSSAWGYQQGVSLERKNPYKSSQLPDNWALSVDPTGGTPGANNSQAVKKCDIAIDSLQVLSESILHTECFSASIRVMNAGIEEINGFSVRFMVYTPDSVISGPAVLDTEKVFLDTLVSGEASKKIVDFQGIAGGVYSFIATAILENDENPHNNADSCELLIGYPERALVINEVMNIPETGETEWFELYNRSDIPLELNRWRLRDANGSWKPLTTQSLVIESDGFCVVSADRDFRQAYPGFDGTLIVPKQFPILNNASDSLFIADATIHPIEQIYFQQDWGGSAGISIERRDPNVIAQTESNWGGSTDPRGATPGEKNSILKYQQDLAISPNSFTFIDSTVSLINPVRFQIAVKNSGSKESGRFSLEVYHDRNGNANVAPDELVWSLHSIPALQPDSVIDLGGDFYSELSGRCHYIAMVAMNGDENIVDNVAACDLLVAYPRGSLRINEFMAYPGAGQTEFCEIVNISNARVNFNEWRFANHRSSTKITRLQKENMEPGEYLVLARDSSFFEYFVTATNNVIIPEKFPGLNNTGDKIVISDLTGTKMDSLVYDDSWSIEQGVSLEKILPANESNDMSNWLLSEASSGATPGYKNSVMPDAYDISLDSVLVYPNTGSRETEFSVLCRYSNAGLNRITSAEISVVAVAEQADPKEVGSVFIDGINTGQSDTVRIDIGKFVSGLHRLAVAVDWDRDMNRGNDSLEFSIIVAFELGALLLSEFMAYPASVDAAGSFVAEYIELYNPGELVLQEAWSICDENTGSPVKINNTNALSPGEFFVIADDSSIFQYSQVKPENTAVLSKFPSLNNTNDGIYLIGPAGTVIDSLIYDSGWSVTENRSLERVYYSNPNTRNNWRLSTAAEGGTPGGKNSVAIESESDKPGVRVEPNPFSPNGDGVDDQVAIQYRLPFPSANINIQIYDLMGRLISEPASNLSSSSQGAVFWDGSSVHGNRARIGMYVVRCSATDTKTDKTVGYVTTVVLAR